jgi:nucleoid-associated protein YgaU
MSLRTLWDTYGYRGRHRRAAERNAAAELATVGVLTLAGVTVAPALAPVTSVAVAAPPGGWEALLDCESDWRNKESYNASSASGYFQIIDSTWAELGGTQFAPRAIQASRAEQEVVANRIYDQRGTRPWNASRHCWRGTSFDRRTADKPDAKPTPHADPPAATPRSRAGTTVPNGYAVQRGDTLSAIARRFGVPGGYREVARVNNIPNPNVIRVGQRLR